MISLFQKYSVYYINMSMSNYLQVTFSSQRHPVRNQSLRINSNQIRKHLILIADPRPNIPTFFIVSPFASSISGIAIAFVDPELAVILLGTERSFLGWLEAFAQLGIFGRVVERGRG
jgi:hypothetical protein